MLNNSTIIILSCYLFIYLFIFFTLLIKYTLWLKFFYRQKARGGHGKEKELLCFNIVTPLFKRRSFCPWWLCPRLTQWTCEQALYLFTTITPQPQTLPKTQYWTICQELPQSGHWEKKKRKCKELGNTKKGAQDSPLGIHLTPGPTAPPCSL